MVNRTSPRPAEVPEPLLSGIQPERPRQRDRPSRIRRGLASGDIAPPFWPTLCPSPCGPWAEACRRASDGAGNGAARRGAGAEARSRFLGLDPREEGLPGPAGASARAAFEPPRGFGPALDVPEGTPKGPAESTRGGSASFGVAAPFGATLPEGRPELRRAPPGRLRAASARPTLYVPTGTPSGRPSRIRRGLASGGIAPPFWPTLSVRSRLPGSSSPGAFRPAFRAAGAARRTPGRSLRPRRSPSARRKHEHCGGPTGAPGGRCGPGPRVGRRLRDLAAPPAPSQLGGRRGPGPRVARRPRRLASPLRAAASACASAAPSPAAAPGLAPRRRHETFHHTRVEPRAEQPHRSGACRSTPTGSGVAHGPPGSGRPSRPRRGPATPPAAPSCRPARPRARGSRTDEPGRWLAGRGPSNTGRRPSRPPLRRTPSRHGLPARALPVPGPRPGPAPRHFLPSKTPRALEPSPCGRPAPGLPPDAGRGAGCGVRAALALPVPHN